MRLPRWHPAGRGQASLLRCQLSSPSLHSVSRKRPKVRPKNWNQRPYLHACVLPKMWLLRIAPLVLRQRRMRRPQLSLKSRKPRLHPLLKYSRLQLRPSRRRKRHLLPLKRSRPRLRLCRQKQNLRLLCNHRSPRPSRRKKPRRLLLLVRSRLRTRHPLPRRPKPSRHLSRRLQKLLRPPRHRRPPLNTSCLLSSAKTGRRCRRLT